MGQTDTTERCANCGDVIGKLETPYVWSGNVVCVRCYQKLTREPLVSSGTTALPENVKPQPLDYVGASAAYPKMSPQRKRVYVVAVYGVIVFGTIYNHYRNGADPNDTIEALFWLTLIYAAVVGIAVWIIRLSGAVLAAGEAARQQTKK